MTAPIDWMYHRKNCTSCAKAQGFLEKHEVPVEEITDARKNTRGRDEALKLARGAKKVVTVRGKKIVTFDMKKDAPDDETLLAHILGPTGNLRAPAIRKGSTLYVGFNEDVYKEIVGDRSR